MAEDLLKKFTVDVDSIKIANQKVTPAFSQGDVKTALLIINVTENEVPIDLTNTNIRASFKKTDGKSVYQDLSSGISVLDAASGKIQIELNTQVLAVKGNVRGQISISDENAGLVAETVEFTINVRESLLNENIVSKDDLPFVEKAISAAETLGEIDLQTVVDNTENLNALKTEVETARGTEVNLDARLIKVDEQLAQKVKKGDLFFNVKDYGAIGDGVNDDTVAIQAAIDALVQVSSPPSGGYVYTGFVPKLVFPTADYRISSSLNINHAYPNIDFQNSRIKPHSSVTNFDFYALNFNGIWNGDFKNLVLEGFTKNIKLYNNNLDSGNIKIDNVALYGGDIGYDIECQSSKITLTNFKFNRVKKVAISNRCDKLSFVHGWMDAGVLDAQYDGMFEVNNSTQLVIDDILYVPRTQTQTASKIFVFKLNSGSINIINSLFGGEAGQIALVGCFGGYATGRGNNIKVKDSIVHTTSSAMIELFNIPNYILIDGIGGQVEATGDRRYVRYNTDLVAYADALTQAGTDTKFYFNNLPSQLAISSAVATDLIRFVSDGAGVTSYGKVTCTNTVYDNILFDAKRNSYDAFIFRRGAIYKLQLANRGNPGVDRYSEYLIQSDFAGTNATIQPIIEGTSTVAARAFVENGIVKVKTNGATGSTAFNYKLTLVDLPVYPYNVG